MMVPGLSWLALGVVMATLTGIMEAQNCRPGYTSERGECVQCRHGYYKTSNGSHACDPCPMDEDGRTASTHFRGAISEEDCYFRPYAKQFSPTFGPLAGGTMVTVEVRHLLDRRIISTKIAKVPAEFMSRTNKTVTFRTSPSSDLNRGIVDIIMVDENHQYMVRSERYFFYRPNPIIYGVDNPETTISGGTLLVVRGENLDSVSKAELVITRVFFGQPREFSSVCTIQSSTVMLCPVPDMRDGLPHELLPGVTGVGPSADMRRKRSTGPEPINNNTLQFFAGFRLDGVTQYSNVTTLTVYRNPEFDLFIEPDHIKMFLPGQKWIQISGQNLDVGFDVVDIRVKVGTADCNVTHLAANQIVCVPPVSQPEPGIHPGPQGSVFVTVYVGQNLSYVVGYLKYGTSLPGGATSPQAFTLIMSLVGIFMVWLVVLWVTCYLCCKKRREKRRKSPVKREEIENPDEAFYLEILDDTPPAEIMRNLDDDVKRKMFDCQLDSERLSLGDIIGKGCYGCILKGDLKDHSTQETKEVTVKTIQDWRDSAMEDILESFLEDSLILLGYRHPNIVLLHGVIIKDSIPYVITEYMNHGDLKKYLSHDVKDISHNKLLRFCSQIAEGMEYLCNKGFVHKDLAARNCLVNSYESVKVGDCGLSRDIYSSDYTRIPGHSKLLPVRWMAPESLEKGIFSSKSDVWSFGVLVWEVMTKGERPYPTVDNNSIWEHLLTGHHLEKPKDISPKMNAFMDQCWVEDPDERPTFEDLAVELHKLMDKEPCLRHIGSETSPGYLELL